MDLDLKRPMLARTLGVEKVGTISRFLLGDARLEDCFATIAPGLVVGLNGGHLQESSELLLGPRMNELLDFVTSQLAPEVVVFDLPPMGGSDDTLAFLPKMDAALLVVAAGQTTIEQVDECEQQLAEKDKLLGLVLNKSQSSVRNQYFY